MAAPFLLGILLLGWLAEGEVVHAGARDPHEADLEAFVREGCPHCEAAESFLQGLQADRPALRVRLRDVGKDPSALGRLESLALRLGVSPVGVPAFFLRGELVIGYRSEDTTGKRLKALLDRPPGPSPEETLPEGACPPAKPGPCLSPGPEGQPEPEAVVVPLWSRLSVREVGLPAFTGALGLLDGFNPCALWVLLFLLSLLVNLRDRLKMALIAGTFVAVSGLVYFLFMAAWLNLFLIIGLSRVTQMALGAIAILVGAVNVKDFCTPGRGVSMSIPESAKPGLYAGVRRILQAENLAGALVGVIALAVLVNLVELLCTAGFPVLYTQVLTLQDLPWWGYYGYLGLYNLAYILDDGLMIALAVVTLSRTRLQERAGRWLKLVSGMVMVAPGGLLILRPEWLTR